MPASSYAPALAGVRDVRPELVDAAAALLSTVVPTRCVGLTPYDSPVMPRFLGAAAALPVGRRTLLLRGITTPAHDNPGAASLVAVADWRVLGPVLFLNGVAVAPRARRLGHARALLSDGLARAADYGCRAIELDVATDNAAAVELYERFGCQPVGVTTWAQVPLAAGPTHPGTWRVRNWPAYASHRDAYGFADLELGGPDGTTTVRVLPGGWRIGEPEPAPSIVAALTDVLRRPEVVFTIRDGCTSRLPDQLVPLASFYRMRLRLG